MLFNRIWVPNKQLLQDCILTDNVMQARFVVKELIAKKLQPHSEGEFVKECLVASAAILDRKNVRKGSEDKGKACGGTQ